MNDTYDSDIEGRQPYPHNAEQAVLAGLMLAPSKWDDVCGRVANIDFCSTRHRLIYQAMELAAERHRPTDEVSITEILRELNQLDNIGGKDYLTELVETYITAINIEAYADIVREASVLRALLSASGEINQSVYHTEGRNATEILDLAESKIFTIKNKYQTDEREGLQHIKPGVAEALQHIQQIAENGNALTGISTGFQDIDYMTTGMQGGDLIIIAGRPSMGKTTFAMNIAENVALSSKLPVAIFSLEMPRRHLILRMISSVGQINQSHLRLGKLETDRDRAKLQFTISELKDAHIYIDDGSNLSIADLRARARRLKAEVGELGLIVVDYLQLMQLPMGKDSRAALVGDLSRGLKLLAKEIDVPVIALSQLSRAVENRPNRRPVMSDIRESGAIEQDADVIMFVYRDAVYNPETADKNLAEIIIAKQRNGPIGTVRLRFEGQYLHFSNLTAQAGEAIEIGFES